MHLVELLFSIITEVLLLRTLSLGFLLISKLNKIYVCVCVIIFFFFCLLSQTSASMTLKKGKKKKKKGKHSCAGLKAACLQHDMGPGPRAAKPWCRVL